MNRKVKTVFRYLDGIINNQDSFWYSQRRLELYLKQMICPKPQMKFNVKLDKQITQILAQEIILWVRNDNDNLGKSTRTYRKCYIETSVARNICLYLLPVFLIISF